MRNVRPAFLRRASFPKTAKDLEELSRTKLAMPVLSIGGAKANGTALGEQAKLVAAEAFPSSSPVLQPRAAGSYQFTRRVNHMTAARTTNSPSEPASSA